MSLSETQQEVEELQEIITLLTLQLRQKNKENEELKQSLNGKSTLIVFLYILLPYH